MASYDVASNALLWHGILWHPMTWRALSARPCHGGAQVLVLRLQQRVQGAQPRARHALVLQRPPQQHDARRRAAGYSVSK